MNAKPLLSQFLFLGTVLAVLGVTSCQESEQPLSPASAKKLDVGKNAQPNVEGPLARADLIEQGSNGKKIEVGKNVWLEIEGDVRRVLIRAKVCRRTDQLEQFMCRRMTKEHEAIVSADCDARDIHKALLLTDAQPGSPVKYQPKFTAAHGAIIKVFVDYEEKGKVKRVPAQQWVRNAKTKKELDQDWVFAGSLLVPNRFDPDAPPIYLANDGDVICLANFETALLDLPIASSKDNDDLVFEAYTERIPPVDTPVVIILEPASKKKK